MHENQIQLVSYLAQQSLFFSRNRDRRVHKKNLGQCDTIKGPKVKTLLLYHETLLSPFWASLWNAVHQINLKGSYTAH